MRKYLAITLFATIIFLQFVITNHASAAAWPMFRLNTAHTARTNIDGPVVGSLQWSIQINGTGSPVIVDNRIYVLGNSLAAVSTNGELIWTFPCVGNGTVSPAVAPDGTVYAASIDGYLYAINPNGTLKWKRIFDGRASASPTIASDGTIYIGSDSGKLKAFKPDGNIKFTYTAGGAIASTPAIAADGTICFGCDNGNLYALTSSGVLKWKFLANPNAALKASPSIGSDGTIYIGSSAGYVYAVWPSGTQRWRFAAGGAIFSSTAVSADGSIILGSRDKYLYCLNPNGTLKWKFQTGNYVDSSPAIDMSGVIYVGSNDGSVYAINPGGTLRWAATMGEGAPSSPIIGDLRTLYVTTSDGQLCCIGSDSTPPLMPIVTDDGSFSCSPNALNASWMSSDPESGISSYEYSVGSAPGLNDVKDWQNAGLEANLTITGLNLLHNISYYINARATNGAGMASEGSSDGIKIDLTSPVISEINGQLTYSKLTFTLQAADPESGVSKMQYALLSSSDIPADPNWVTTASVGEIEIPGTYANGQVYYVIARAANVAGAWSEIRKSNVIRLDKTPPSTPVITDDGAFWFDQTTIHASWTSTDTESGIDHYSYCIGSSAGIDNIVKWTNTNENSITLTSLNLINGVTYYISVWAINGVGLESLTGISDGITIDTTPPSQPSVMDDGEYTNISESLHASWISNDAQSGIAEYEYCIGASPGSANIVSWTSTLQTSVTANNLLLEPGIPYYFSVRAKNQAGKWSMVGSSDGIEFQSSLSVWPKFRCDPMNSGCTVVNAACSGRLRWRVQTQGYIESSPAIAGDGTIYIGSSDGKLYAISSSGSVRWTYQTGSTIDSSPAIGSNGLVYVGSYDGGLYCIHPNGTLKWRFAAGGMIWSSPAIAADGTIYFGCMDSCLYAINPNGSLKWKYKSGGTVWSSPALDSEGNIYFGCGDAKFYCIKPDGTLKWTFDTGSAIDSSPCVSKDGNIYFGSGDGYFYAVKPNGTFWWKAFMGNVVDSSAAITPNGNVCVGSGGAGTLGVFYLFTADGKEIWRINLPGGVRSSPAVTADGTILVGSSDSKLYCINPEGHIIWSFKTGDSILASAGLSNNGAVVIGSDDGGIYCLRDMLTSDTTPPSVPAVWVKKCIITPELSIIASWSSTDAESGIESYSYAIGTEKGADDVVSWTNVGFTTNIERSGLNLRPGQSYYVSVVARNNQFLTSGVGVCEPIVVVPSDRRQKIGMAKKSLESTFVYLPGKVVVAVYDDCLFVEEADRSSGMRVIASETGLQVGAVVDIQARVVSQNEEMVLVNASFLQQGFSDAMKPLCISGRTFKGAEQSLPLGLLVRMAGKVVDVGDNYFIISDGTSLAAVRGSKGIEVRVDPRDLPAKNTWVAATGVLCNEQINSKVTTIIRAIPNTHLTAFE